MKLKPRKLKITFIFILPVIVILSCGEAEQKKQEGNDKAEEHQVDPDDQPLNEDKYLKAGKEIAGKTQKVLGKALKQKLGKGGVEAAITYCNVNAMPLTDSLSSAFNAIIKRASHKPRNPQNKAGKEEMAIIKEFQESLKEKGKNPKPVISETNEGKVVFYAPILTKPLCLNCHGETGKTLTEENHKIIKGHYPEDKATDFKEGDLRGIWSIEFNEL